MPAAPFKRAYRIESNASAPARLEAVREQIRMIAREIAFYRRAFDAPERIAARAVLCHLRDARREAIKDSAMGMPRTIRGRRLGSDGGLTRWSLDMAYEGLLEVRAALALDGQRLVMEGEQRAILRSRAAKARKERETKPNDRRERVRELAADLKRGTRTRWTNNAAAEQLHHEVDASVRQIAEWIRDIIPPKRKK